MNADLFAPFNDPWRSLLTLLHCKLQQGDQTNIDDNFCSQCESIVVFALESQSLGVLHRSTPSVFTFLDRLAQLRWNSNLNLLYALRAAPLHFHLTFLYSLPSLLHDFDAASRQCFYHLFSLAPHRFPQRRLYKLLHQCLDHAKTLPDYAADALALEKNLALLDAAAAHDDDESCFSQTPKKRPPVDEADDDVVTAWIDANDSADRTTSDQFFVGLAHKRRRQAHTASDATDEAQSGVASQTNRQVTALQSAIAARELKHEIGEMATKMRRLSDERSEHDTAVMKEFMLLIENVSCLQRTGSNGVGSEWI